MADSKSKKRSGLGRGLSALLDDSGENTEISGYGAAPKGNIGEIDIDLIETNPYQPRTDFDQEALEELANSIRVQGIIQPITVRALNATSFQLISGERRLTASKMAGLTQIPAYIRTADDQQMLEMALIENIQRENLNAIEIALSYQRLLDECKIKQEELGDRVGKNRATVNNYLRLLRLPPDIQIALRDGKISMGHARALITLEKVDHQLDILKKIQSQDLSVRQVEALVRALMTGKEKDTKKPEEIVNPEVKRLQDKLSSHFGTKIQIKSDQKSKGEITIPFTSADELNRILEILEV